MKLHKMIGICAYCFVILQLSSLDIAETSPADQEKKESNAGPFVPGQAGLTAPVVLINPSPAYTEEARKSHIKGTIVIRGIVRKDGALDDLKIEKGLGYGLDESAINTLTTEWRFKPGTLNGVPVAVMVQLEVDFKIYELKVLILKSHWKRSSDGRMNGSGQGNLLEDNSDKSVIGFTYTCSCKAKLDIGLNSATWVERESRIRIISHWTNKAWMQYPDPCELKVTMQKFMYELKGGSLKKHPIEKIERDKQ
jgi:TonB family protein